MKSSVLVWPELDEDGLKALLRISDAPRKNFTMPLAPGI